MKSKIRCDWVGDLPIYIEYHDNEWGHPVYDDTKLFEMLVLESMQAGLSWITILKKRENFRLAFDDFNPNLIANYDQNKIEELMQDTGIIRNRMKIEATINNAKLFLEITKNRSFNDLIWSYVNYQPIIGNWERIDDLPASTPLSDKISKDFKKMGFKFLGTTTIYAFMQACGLVNDHLNSCFLKAK